MLRRASAVMKAALAKGAASMASKTPVRMDNARSVRKGSNAAHTNARARRVQRASTKVSRVLPQSSCIPHAYSCLFLEKVSLLIRFPQVRLHTTQYSAFDSIVLAEGFYPFYYPPAGFLAVGPDGQPVHADPSGAQQGIPQPQYYSLHPASFPPYPFPHAAGGAYPMMPGHMLAQAGPSGTDSDGGTAPTEPVARTGSETEEVPSEVETQQTTRGKKRKGATSPTSVSAVGNSGERNEPSKFLMEDTVKRCFTDLNICLIDGIDERVGTSKKAGKKAAVANPDATGGDGGASGTGGS